jgi:hypothetical protein
MTLSDKIYEDFDTCEKTALKVEDVKKFIMDIKSEISSKFMGSDEHNLHKLIDKLAGDKLK